MGHLATENANDLWEEFGDIPMNPETECIEQAWRDFPVGTHREDIWYWFEETFGVSVYDLMYGDECVEEVNDDDYCYECSSYGNNYFINDDGEWEYRCPECPMNPDRPDDWDD